MKSHAAVVPTAKQRRWKWLALAVLLLVFFSMLVPLAFLLGLHSGFPVGYSSDESSPTDSLEVYERKGGGKEINSSKYDSRVEQMLRNFTPSLPQEIVQDITGKDDMKIKTSDPNEDNEQTTSGSMGDLNHSEYRVMTPVLKGLHNSPADASNADPVLDKQQGGIGIPDGSNLYGSHKSCQLEFGSYCLWSMEHKEAMEDGTVKKLKDQLFVARAYYPSIAKLQGQENLSREMKQNIQEHERMLSEAISDADLPPIVAKVIQKMDQTIAKAKGCAVECSNVERKLRQILDLTEDETHFHRKQSAFLYHLGVQTMPKSLHCLSMRLTVEYFRDPPSDMELSHAYKFDNPSFHHYVIFSRDILAVSVTVNSTIKSSKITADMVFHIITDRQNFYAMKLWFARNSYEEAIIQVLNIEDLNLSNGNELAQKQVSSSEEFRVSIRSTDPLHLLQMKTHYLSTFGHSHFLLPEIFQNLKKVIVLDDDVIVQQDLSDLWNVDLEGKVNGAVSFCELRLVHLKAFLGRNLHDDSCLWMSGLNIIDLEKWREQNLTAIYQKFLHSFHNGSEASWRTAVLPASLLAFQGLVFPITRLSIISGLGHKYGISEETIRNAFVLHYNGNMKPWLDLGIPAYKAYWRKFLTQGERFMDECNVHH
ncbi:hypothetical protein HPP92_014928 [Vanilla planifolia]|uniref:Hexosyltransferase n=1 Tax=Vanilla planifolia TaxID=51239 RepID=A0A835UVU0_VANPL|nr:hypothetical protein HPP92_015448 [Vanilla planifolia]KAG0475242.1 hypothetical protein HPP92_014928 [Vanilla planifolia]